MLVMISQNGLCSCRSDSPDNAIYLGREEAPQVPHARQKTLHFFARLLIWAALNRQDVAPPPSSFELVGAVGAALYWLLINTKDSFSNVTVCT